MTPAMAPPKFKVGDLVRLAVPIGGRCRAGSWVEVIKVSVAHGRDGSYYHYGLRLDARASVQGVMECNLYLDAVTRLGRLV